MTRFSRAAGVLIALLPAFSAVAFPQSVHVTARVDSNAILIGDWLPLHIEVEHPSNSTVEFPAIPDSLNGFEVVRRDAPVKKTEAQGVLESATFVLTAFDSGMHVVPPLTVTYTTAGDTAKHTMETSPLPVVVHGIPVDTSKEIRDVKPPLSVPITFADILPYLIGVVVLGGLVWLFIYVRSKRKRGESLIPEAPPRPADEVALDALRSLESEQLWQRGKIKEYHSQLTDIVRLYIERKFGTPALESTTDEIVSSGPVRELPREGRDGLTEVLTLADLVKFAKFQPSPQEHERSMRLAVSFIQSTRGAARHVESAEEAREVNQPQP